MDEITADQIEAIQDLDIDSNDMVDFGDLARNVLGMQCQYASRYVDGRVDFPDLGSDLRIDGDSTTYHSILIHKDDLETFVKRVNEYRRSLGF